MSLEIFTKEKAHGLPERVLINGELAEFLWGFKLVEGTSEPKSELVYEGTHLSDFDIGIHQQLKGLGYTNDEHNSVLYVVASVYARRMPDSKPKQIYDMLTLKDYRYILFGSKEFYKQFLMTLNGEFKQGSISPEDYMYIYHWTCKSYREMLMEWGKIDVELDGFGTNKKLTEIIRRHIKELGEDELTEYYLRKARERLH